MKKRIFLVVFMIIAIVLLAGCSKEEGSSSSGQVSQAATAASEEKSYTLKFQHLGVEGDAYDLGAKRFKELAEEYSGGSLTIELYSNGELASGANAVQSVQMGTLNIVAESSMTEANFIPTFDVLNLPFLFENLDQVWAVLDGPVGEELKADAEASGFKVLCFWDNGFRNVSNNTRAINSVADVAGLKIRVPENSVFVDTWETLGAIPTPMAWSEVYTGLQQHVIDAQENPIPFIYGGRIHEVQKYLAMTDHKYEYVTMAMSLRRWNSLTPEQQKIIKEASAAATKYENELVATKTQELLEIMKKEGLQVTNPDKEEFAKVARTAHADFAKSIGQEDLYQRILKELGR